MFSPLRVTFLGFVLCILLFLTPRSFPRVQVTVCCGRPPRGSALALVGLGELVKGAGPRAPPPAPPQALPPPLSRLPLCPGFVCEVGMTIAATFQPTSQGCCGDTVISDIVML